MESQKQYLCNNIEELSKRTERIRSDNTKSRKNFTWKYYLPKDNGHERVDVRLCETMFLNILSVTLIKTQYISLKKRESVLCIQNRRGKDGNQLKTSLDADKHIKYHIQMFPIVYSHYSRNQTQKK